MTAAWRDFPGEEPNITDEDLAAPEPIDWIPRPSRGARLVIVAGVVLLAMALAGVGTALGLALMAGLVRWSLSW